MLWDASEQGPKVFVGTENVLLGAAVPTHLVARLPAALDDREPLRELRATVRPDANGAPQFAVHEQGQAEEEGGDGHGQLALPLCDGRADQEAARAEHEAGARAHMAGREPSSVGALLRPRFVAEVVPPSETSDQVRLRVSAEVSAPSVTLVASPIRSLRCAERPPLGLCPPAPCNRLMAHTAPRALQDPAHAAVQVAGRRAGGENRRGEQRRHALLAPRRRHARRLPDGRRVSSMHRHARERPEVV